MAERRPRGEDEPVTCLCGRKCVVVTRKRRIRTWGWGTYVLPNGKRDAARVTAMETFSRCPKCKEEFFTVDQMNRSQRENMRATLALFQRRLGYRENRRALRRRVSNSRDAIDG